MEIKYRAIEQQDNAALAEVIRSVFREFNIDRPGTAYYDPSTEHLFELFAKKGSFYLVATDRNQIIGGCGIYPTDGLPDGCAELVKFYLLPDYRNAGIGKELMLRCFDEAKKMAYKQLYLESMPELGTAVGMYEKYGFRHIPERLGCSGHFACDILMLKEL